MPLENKKMLPLSVTFVEPKRLSGCIALSLTDTSREAIIALRDSLENVPKMKRPSLHLTLYRNRKGGGDMKKSLEEEVKKYMENTQIQSMPLGSMLGTRVVVRALGSDYKYERFITT